MFHSILDSGACEEVEMDDDADEDKNGDEDEVEKDADAGVLAFIMFVDAVPTINLLS